MLKINCKTADTIRLQSLVPFQGELKKRKKEDIDCLIKSLSEEGMMMPFAVWKHDEKCYLLDGHGRMEALLKLMMSDTDLITQDFPCIFIEADDEESARKSLLQITSTYGRVSKKGILDFTATIPDYVAPVVLSAKPKLHKKRAVQSTEGYVQFTVKAPKDIEAKLKEVLKSMPGVIVAG